MEEISERAILWSGNHSLSINRWVTVIQNQAYFLRHGLSIAEVKGLISYSLSDCISKHVTKSLVLSHSLLDINATIREQTNHVLCNSLSTSDAQECLAQWFVLPPNTKCHGSLTHYNRIEWGKHRVVGCSHSPPDTLSKSSTSLKLTFWNSLRRWKMSWIVPNLTSFTIRSGQTLTILLVHRGCNLLPSSGVLVISPVLER